MINERYIKPIPKYILALIKREDKKHYKEPTGKTRYYSYLTKNDGELACITVAVKHHYKKWYCNQVVVHGLHSETCFVKDIDLHYIAGYITGWYAEGISKREKEFEDGNWYPIEDKYFNLDAPVVNVDFLGNYPEYRYSQVENYQGRNILHYLRLYEQYPQMELLIKFGYKDFVTNKSILNKTSKDKRFAKWLISRREEITSYRNKIYATALLRAYKKNTSIIEAQKYLKFRNSIKNEYRLKSINKLFKGDKAIERLIFYLSAKNIDVYTYADYIDACVYLNIDLTQEKNLIPHDFKRWHDERIEQQSILEKERHRKWVIAQSKLRAKWERERKAEEIRHQRELNTLEAKFIKVAKRFAKLQICEQSDYIIVIAKTPGELIIEGQQLKHCVGGENYRLRMSKAESLIFFVRETAEPDKPFVTVEYSPTKQEVLQCYGDNDLPPNDSVKQFIYNKWLPFANKQLNKIKKAVTKAA